MVSWTGKHVCFFPVLARALLIGLARRVRPFRPGPTCSFSTLRLKLVLTRGIPPDFRGGVHLFILSTAIGSVSSLSGHAIAYRWRSLPCSADHEQDWQPYPVDPYSAICDDHTYIVYIHTYCRESTGTGLVVLNHTLFFFFFTHSTYCHCN